MHDSGDDWRSLTPAVERAAALLRDEPPVSAEWRAELLLRVSSDRGATSTTLRRRWSLSPFTAIAAALVCAVVGGASTVAVMKSRQAPVSAAPVGASRVRFALVAPHAMHVSIVGDFNQWNPAALPLRRLSDGQTWEIEVPLPPGRYTYAFFIDGRVARDTAAAESANDGFGIPNSVVLVKGS